MLWVSHSVAGDVFFNVFVFFPEGLKMVFMTFLGTFFGLFVHHIESLLVHLFIMLDIWCPSF